MVWHALLYYTAGFANKAHKMYRNYYFCNRYRNGIRGHMKAVVLSLLRQYLQHEVLFNEGINKLIYNSKRKVKFCKHSFTVVSIYTECSLSFPFFLVVLLSNSVSFPYSFLPNVTLLWSLLVCWYALSYFCNLCPMHV